MTEKWDVKDVLQHARELKSPFEKQSNPQPNIERLRQVLGKRGNGRENQTIGGQ